MKLIGIGIAFCFLFVVFQIIYNEWEELVE